jgi:hypothetical protein
MCGRAGRLHQDMENRQADDTTLKLRALVMNELSSRCFTEFV